MRRLLVVLSVLTLVCGCLGGGGEVGSVSSSTVRASTSTTAWVPTTSLEPAVLMASPDTTTTSVRKVSTTTVREVKVCPRFYARFGSGCCLDVDGNGVCDSGGGTSSTTTSSTLDPFTALFNKVANRTIIIPLANGSSVNENFPTTSSTLYENFTSAYNNRYDFGDTKYTDPDHRYANVSGCTVRFEKGLRISTCNASYEM